jgi:hypothetical protein
VIGGTVVLGGADVAGGAVLVGVPLVMGVAAVPPSDEHAVAVSNSPAAAAIAAA